MLVGHEKKFYSNLQGYKSAVENLRPIKRPMLIWSVVSLIYFWGDLHLKVDTIALWGIKISGITDKKFTFFLLLATLYYMIKWGWSNFLELRFYWRQGVISDFRMRSMDSQRAKETVERWDPDLIFGKDTDGINNKVKNTLFDWISDLTKSTPMSRFVTSIENFLVPYILPFSISGLALLVLMIRLSSPNE